MLMDVAWVKDCFESWRASSDGVAPAELALVLVDGNGTPTADNGFELPALARCDAAFQPHGIVWSAPDGERFRVRAERLKNRESMLLRIRREPACSSVQAGLSRREQEVFACLAEGMSYKEIAQRLFISCHTSRKHIENIYTKLNVCNRVEAINKLRGSGKIRQTA